MADSQPGPQVELSLRKSLSTITSFPPSFPYRVSYLFPSECEGLNRAFPRSLHMCTNRIHKMYRLLGGHQLELLVGVNLKCGLSLSHILSKSKCILHGSSSTHPRKVVLTPLELGV